MVEGDEPDGVSVEEELLLCGILVKRKSWAGLKCLKPGFMPCLSVCCGSFCVGHQLACGMLLGGVVRAVWSPWLTLHSVRCWAGHTKHSFFVPLGTALTSYVPYSPLVKNRACCSAHKEVFEAQEW